MNKENETTNLAARKLSKIFIILVLAVYFHPISSIGNDAMSALAEDAGGILCPFTYQVHYLADIISVCILTLLMNTGLCMTLKEEREKRAELEAANALLEADNAALEADNQTMHPKADYYDELSDMNQLLNFRDTSKKLKIKEKAFIQLLIDRKYIYRNISGKLCPFAKYVPDLFEVKEQVNSQANWCGTQTLITPKGRDAFRRLCKSLQPAA